MTARSIAIGCSYRFEELNVLCEILKLNFKGPWETHAFCNLNVTEFRKYGRFVAFENIDCFHHVPDEACSPRNVALNEAKRRQPLALFLSAVDYFARHGQDFVWVEGDFVPFDNERIREPFEWLSEWDVVANYFDFRRDLASDTASDASHAHWQSGRTQSAKMPHGYVLPTPIYLSGRAAPRIADFIRTHLAMLTDGSRNHEGNLALIFDQLGLKRRNFSAYFCVSYPYLRDVDPQLMFFHPHNLFAPARWLKERGITRGPWLEKIMTRTRYFRPITWRLERHDPRCEPVLSDFKVIYADEAGAGLPATAAR